MNNNIFSEKIKRAFEHNGYSSLLTDSSIGKFFNLAELLVEASKITNLTAITDEDGIILKHFLDCATISKPIPKNSKVIDVGCGGGFPSLPIAIIREDISVLSLDSTGKKIDFVNSAIKELGLKNSRAICARAEDYAKQAREEFDCCVSRAVARLNVLDELCLPFIKIGGVFIAMKSEKAKEELTEAESGIIKLGGRIISTEKQALSFGGNTASRETIIISKISETPEQYPRKYAQILKKPL